ncbi:MAG TPA: (d)CMP kinase [Desulfotignum sp.]|nr:(d)CMP kinase [Desulfotignum sp.]
MPHRIITIDGPAGAGKTTVSTLLAQDLGCIRVDTGALYRGVAHEIMQQNIDWENDAALKNFLSTLDLQFQLEKDGLRLFSSGKDITSHIRTSRITMLASAVSANPAVRSALLALQRSISQQQDAVFEGRDMGTVVFPDAFVKFFLFADLSIRARRRYDEMQDAPKDFSCVMAEMEKRDTDDAQRTQAPLKPASDAIHIDASFLTPRQVVDKMHTYL